MTKKVRIENADAGKDIQLKVELIEINPTTKEETVITSSLLPNPADVVSFHIWNNRYIKVSEVMEA
tara:strand:- start:4271 stop:4468 length:198 start_codon:yes stop_codon:yes gene_type:complete